MITARAGGVDPRHRQSASRQPGWWRRSRCTRASRGSPRRYAPDRAARGKNLKIAIHEMPVRAVGILRAFRQADRHARVQSAELADSLSLAKTVAGRLIAIANPPATKPRDADATSCADTVTNTEPRIDAGHSRMGRSVPRRRRQHRVDSWTVPITRRVVRSDDVIRPLPGTRPRALPSASERVVASARPSPRPDVFAPHDNR
jgi:hypothetical protein